MIYFRIIKNSLIEGETNFFIILIYLDTRQS